MKELQFAFKNTIPIFFTYLFIGIAFGILMSDAGYGVLLSTVSAFPAFFIVRDTVTHLYHTDIPVMGIGKNVAEILFQNGFKPGIDDGSSHRHTGKDFSLRTDVHMVFDKSAGKAFIASLSAAVFLSGNAHDPCLFMDVEECA